MAMFRVGKFATTGARAPTASMIEGFDSKLACSELICVAFASGNTGPQGHYGPLLTLLYIFILSYIKTINLKSIRSKLGNNSSEQTLLTSSYRFWRNVLHPSIVSCSQDNAALADLIIRKLPFLMNFRTSC